MHRPSWKPRLRSKREAQVDVRKEKREFKLRQKRNAEHQVIVGISGIR